MFGLGQGWPGYLHEFPSSSMWDLGQGHLWMQAKVRNVESDWEVLLTLAISPP